MECKWNRTEFRSIDRVREQQREKDRIQKAKYVLPSRRLNQNTSADFVVSGNAQSGIFAPITNLIH
jgi:hypothetical protein